MSHHYTPGQLLPLLDELTPRDRRLAERAVKEQDARRLKHLASRARRAEALAEEYERKLSRAVGTRLLAEARLALREARRAFAGRFSPPQGLARDVEQERRRLREHTAALLRKHGATSPKVRRLARDFRDAVQGVLAPVAGTVVPGFQTATNLKVWNKLSPLNRFNLPWGDLPTFEVDPNDPHRFELFRPPFFGFLFPLEIVATGEFRADRILTLEPPVGFVGNECTMDCSDGGNFNVASVDAESLIAFGFRAPATGVLEVLIDAQSLVGSHAASVSDEFGFSSAFCSQSNFLIMNVLHPNVAEPSMALLSSAGLRSDGDDKTFASSNLVRGQHHFARLFSAGPVPAGQHVVITVGTRTFDIAAANDMSLHSRSNFQWFINSVQVRVAP